MKFKVLCLGRACHGSQRRALKTVTQQDQNLCVQAPSGGSGQARQDLLCLKLSQAKLADQVGLGELQEEAAVNGVLD